MIKNCLQVVTGIIFALVLFSSETRSFTSRKLYACLAKFSCFLQLSDRAYVSGARCIGVFLV